ncbi:MAG: hypothetical protein AB7P03_28345 [Kofleriaceae bacterium]
MACGPSGRPAHDDDDDDDDDTVDAPGLATLSGRVWAPNQGPGQAPVGEEIPIAGALIYISTDKPEGIPDHVYCERCVPTPQGSVLSGADGSFSLDLTPGHYFVTIQKGQYQLEAEYDLPAGMTTLTPEQSTLPSVWDPDNGKYMPRMAMAQGTNDNIEDILGKLGVGTLAGDTFSSPVGEKGAEIAIYEYDTSGPTSVTYLLDNIDEMRKYHIIFFPCATTMSSLNAKLSDQTVLANIRRYVSEGGKLYVTDWSGELADRAFPQQIELGDIGADSVGTYDPTTFTGTLTTEGNADGGLYGLSDGNAVDAGLNAWLGMQVGPTEGGVVPTMYNANSFEVTDLWNWVKKLNSVQIGVDDMGMPIYDEPKAWVTGSKPGQAGGMNRPIAVTYEPTGCGKVLYTAFQTANSPHHGLYPQERVLLYLIMEIQTCSGPIF